MGNLYAWTDKVVGAVEGGVKLEDCQVYGVFMAARDLVSWTLWEEGKREIDRLWEGVWGWGVGARGARGGSVG